MLTPKEKAKELICMFTFVETEYKKIGKRMIAKRCAKIAVEECLQTCVESSIYYWKEVLTEIEKYMTPKEKAKELFNKIRYMDNESGKDCITCDCVVLPIVKFICKEIINKNNSDNDYWKEVLTEIDNL